jgi:hypothetical protein
VAVTLMTPPESPLTVIVDGYGVAGPDGPALVQIRSDQP